MSIDDFKIIASITTLLSLIFGLYQYFRSNPIYKFKMFSTIEPNNDMSGTYLCARIHISNSGGKIGVFNGFIAIGQKGEEYFPLSTFSPEEEIEPQKTISGVIPVGHLITYPPKVLYMQDGLLKKKKIPRKLLKKTIQDLKKDLKRYEKEGLAIHPNNSFKNMHNKPINRTENTSALN